MTNPTKYEAVLVFEATLTEDQVADQIKKVGEVISKNGGTVESTTSLGKKRLAYPINRRREGIYHQIDFVTDTDNTCLSELNRYLRITEEIIRSLVTVAVIGKSKGRDLSPDEMARFLPRGGGRRPGGPPRDRYGSGPRSSGPRDSSGPRESGAPRESSATQAGAGAAGASSESGDQSASAPASAPTTTTTT